MNEAILVLNTGSSSIKFALYEANDLTLLYHGKIANVFAKPQLTAWNQQHKQIVNESISFSGYESSLAHLFDWLRDLPNRFSLKAVGHRVVHGGTIFHGPCLISNETIEQLDSLVPLAPMHQPLNILAIKNVTKFYPTLPQIACFDTTFHRTQEKLATLFAIPKKLSSEGIIRYGFHGISYEYIASVLPEQAKNKVIVAHLGNGASLCAMKNGKSLATSMGLTALDGLMMGSRCGAIDPGVLLYLLQEKKYTLDQLSALLYEESGLLGVSGISSNMQELQFSSAPDAVEAVDLFCYRAARELSALLATLQGLDTIIFTAGIGENSAIVRKKICERLEWLGVVLDEEANLNNDTVISSSKSRVLVSVIPTNEEYMIAKHSMTLI